ncbi:MAG: peptidoglycan DD-metalloendopeptidase family protein [Gemmatimonadota bacterium]|nr:peptidoglycan DD-metalloendopeptidase family protein [Gemmatimonadota bacterium]
MTRSKWTVMLVPHSDDPVRSLQVTGAKVRTVVASVLLFALGFAGVSVVIIGSRAGDARAQRLERERVRLSDEVTELRSQMAELSTSIEDLSAKSERYRAIAGLDEIDEQIQLVGVGGPGTPTLESFVANSDDPQLGEQVFAASYDLATLLRRANLLGSSMDEALRTLEENKDRLAAMPTISPSTGYLSSLFSNSRRHPVLKISRPHQGIDIAAPVGEPILAPAAGRVIFARNQSGGYGNTVEIDHGHGYVTRFAHISRILVREGEKVERGQTIAEVGSTGLTTGPHLHYEVELNGVSMDPLNFIISDDALPE